MTDPFRPLIPSVPVALWTPEQEPVPPGTIVLRLGSDHDHGLGAPCPACAAQGDLRTRLFDQLVRLRQGDLAPFAQVLVHSPDGWSMLEEALLPGRKAVSALRERTVLKSFHLAPQSGRMANPRASKAMRT